MSECIFCQIIAGVAPASFVYEDNLACAFMDTQPVNPGHLLVVPRVHARAMGDLPAEIARHMMAVAQRLMKAMRSAPLCCEGVNLLLADGEAAGQEVDHVHLHVIPRYKGDGFGFRFAPDYGALPQRGHLDKLATAIREAMDET